MHNNKQVKFSLPSSCSAEALKKKPKNFKKKKSSSSKSKDQDKWWYSFSKEACRGKVIDPEEPGAEMMGVLSCAELKKRISILENEMLQEFILKKLVTF